MSQPTDSAGRAESYTKSGQTAEKDTFSLQVLSPSEGVPHPLEFLQLPVTTKVRELKILIRDELPSKPEAEYQRLIYRGHMLARDSETMLEIFGQETLKDSGFHVLHLVLRPPPETQGSSSISTIGSRETDMPAGANLGAQRISDDRPSDAAPTAAQHHQLIDRVPEQNILQQAEYTPTMSERVQRLTQEMHRLHQQMDVVEEWARTRINGQNAEGQPSLQEMITQHQRERAAQGLPTTSPWPSDDELIRQQQRAEAQVIAHFSQQQRARDEIRAQLAQLSPIIQDLTSQLRGERAAEGQLAAQVSPSLQNLTSQQQSEPAAESQRQQESGNSGVGGIGFASGQVSSHMPRPHHSATYTREGVGSNGERWQVTVNETTTTSPAPHQNSVLHIDPTSELQALLRNADRLMVSQEAQHNLSTTTSNSLLSRGVTNMRTPSSISTPNTRNIPTVSLLLNPELNPSLRTIDSNLQVSNTVAHESVTNEPTVYILSSPTGPRGLLMSGTETFFTPLQRPTRRDHSTVPITVGETINVASPPEPRNRLPRQFDRDRHNINNLVEPGLVAPHANPPAGALGIQLGHTIWLIIRLVGFVWFFTAGNPSWTRWFMVSGLALIVFIIHTGVFNSIAEQLWAPIRRHLEALIPLGPPPHGAVLQDGNPAPIENGEAGLRAALPATGNDNGNRRRRGELDPVEVAARIMERQRLANGGWLMAQLRQIEQSLLLFVASLVPGVGERHIAHREAEATREAERQRHLGDIAEPAASVDLDNNAAEDESKDQNTIENGENSNGHVYTDGD